jgi:hypothetical protein
MSDNNNNHGPEMVIGGSLLALFFAMFIIKALKQFFLELGQAFEAFGHMTGSFVFMLWNILQVVFLVSLIIASVVAAVYFTIKYWQMVTDGTALREWVQSSMAELEGNVGGRLEKFGSNVNQRIEDLDDRLTSALTKPEVAPEMGTQTVDGSAGATADDSPIDNGSDEYDDSQPDEFSEDEDGIDPDDLDQQSDSKTDSVTMSNPY